MEQPKYCCGYPCEGKGRRDGGYHKGGKKQEDEERGFGMCLVCDGE